MRLSSENEVSICQHGICVESKNSLQELFLSCHNVVSEEWIQMVSLVGGALPTESSHLALYLLMLIYFCIFQVFGFVTQ